MHDLKFKLKRDGKVVGYMRISQSDFGKTYGIDTLSILYSHDGGEWESSQRISFDSIHPWVCQDCNGADVYCDDLIWRIYGTGIADRDRVQVSYDERRKQYRVHPIDIDPDVWWDFDEFHPIELLDPQPEGDRP